MTQRRKLRLDALIGEEEQTRKGKSEGMERDRVTKEKAPVLMLSYGRKNR